MKIGKQFLVALWATISAAIMTVGLAIVVPTVAHAEIATSYNVTWEIPEGTPKYEIYTSVPEGTYKARLTDATGAPLAAGTQVWATWPTLWTLDDGTGPTKRAQERQAVLESCDRYIWDPGDIQHRECYGYNDPGAYPRRLVTVGEDGYVTFPTFKASNDWKTLFQFYASGTQGTQDMIGDPVRFTVIPGEPFPESSYLLKEATEDREVGQTMVYTTPTKTTDQYEEQVFYAIPHDRYWNNYHGQDYKGWDLGKYVYVSNSVGIPENAGPYFSIQNRNWEAITGSVKPVLDVPAGFEWIEEPKWVPERGAFEGKYRAKWPGERQIPNTAAGGESPADESLYFWMNMAPWGKPNEYRLLGSVGTRKNISAPRAVTVKVNKAGTEAKYDEMLVAGYLRTGDKLFVNGNEFVTKGSRGKVCPSQEKIPTTQLVSTYTLEKDVTYPDTLDLVQEVAADQLKIDDTYRQNLIKQFRFAKLCATLIDNEYWTSNGYPIHNPKLQNGVLVPANPEYRDGIYIARISTKVNVNIEWEPLDKPLKMTGTKNSATQTGSVTVVVPEGTPNNAEVVLFNDAGVAIARKTITGEVTEAAGREVTFDFGGAATLAFASVTNTVQAYIAQNITGDGVTIGITPPTGSTDKRFTEKVTYSFFAPVVTSATRDINGNIEISGTTPADTEEGTEISIKNAAGDVIGTAVVQADGTWSLSTTAGEIGTNAPAANTNVSAAMGPATGPSFTVVPQPVPVSDVVAVRNPATGVTSITATADAPAGTPVSITLPDGTKLTGEVGADGKIGPLTTSAFNAGAAVTVTVSDGTYSGSASGTVTEQAVPAQTPAPIITSAVVGTDGGLTVTGNVPNVATGTPVVIKDANNNVLGTAETDADGNFTLTQTAEQLGENAPSATDKITAVATEQGKESSKPGAGTVVEQLPAPTKVEGVRSADGSTLTVNVTVDPNTPDGAVVQVLDPSDPTKVLGFATYSASTPGAVPVALTGDAATTFANATKVPVNVAPAEGTTGYLPSDKTEGGIKDQTPTPTNVTVTVLPDGSVVVAGEVPGAADGTTVDVTLPNGDVIEDVPVKDGKFDSSASPFTPTSPVKPGAEGVTAVATDGKKAPSEPGAVTVNGQLPAPTKVEGVRSADGETVTVAVTIAAGTPANSVVQVVDPTDPTKVLGFVTYPGGSDPVTIELTGDAADKFPEGTQVPVQVAPGDGATNTVVSTPTKGDIKDQTPTPTNVTVTVLPDGTVVVAGEVPGAADGTTVDVTLPNGDVIEDVPVKDGKFDSSASPFTPTSPVEPGVEGVTAVATEEGKAPSTEGTGTVNGQLPAPTKVEGVRSADGDTVTVSVTVDPKTPAGSVVQVLDPTDPTKVLGFVTYPGDGKPVTVELTGDAADKFPEGTQVPVQVAPAEAATNTVSSTATEGDIKDQTPTPTNVTVTVLPDGTVVVAGEVPGAADGTTVDVTLPNGDVIEDVPVKDGKFDSSDSPFTPTSPVKPGVEGVTAVATDGEKAPSEPGAVTVNGQLPAPTKVEGVRSADGDTVTVTVTVDPNTPANSVVQVVDPNDPTKVLGFATYPGDGKPVTVELTGDAATALDGVSEVPVRVAPDVNAVNTVPSASTEGTVAGPVASATLTTDKDFAEGPVVAGTDVEFTYTPVDANGNVVDMGETIDLAIPGSTQPLKLQRQADGTYKGTTKLTTATPNNGADADQATVIVTGQPNAAASTDVKVKADVAKNVTATVTSDYAAYGVKKEDPLDFGDPATVTYTVTDDYGNPADLPAGTTITATGTSAAGESKVDDPTRTKLGTYTQKVQLQITGPRPQKDADAVRTATLNPSVSGLTVTPVELHYTSPPVNTKPEYSNYTVEPVATGTDATVYANGADQYKITVKLGAHDDKDPKRWADQVIKGRAPALNVTGLREGDTVTSFIDNGDGTYTAYVTSTVPGAPKLGVNISDSPLTATVGSVTPEFAPQVIDPTKSEFTTSASEVTSGEQVTFTYTPKDPHGQPIPATSPALKDKSFTTSPLADGTTVALTPTANGTFAGIYTPEAPAALTNVTPQEGGKDVGPARPLTVTPGTFNVTKSSLTFLDTSGNPLTTPVTAGTEVTLKFVPRDDKGYPLGGKVNNAATVSVSVTGIDKPVVLTWSDKEQAYVSKPFKQTKAGSNTATGIGDIVGASAEDTVTPTGPHHVTWSGPDADPWNQGTVPASTGDTVAIPPVTVVDEFGNPVAPGTEVTVTTPDGTSTTVKVGDNGTLPLDPSITLPTTPGDVKLTLTAGTTPLDTVTFTVTAPTTTPVTVTTAEIGPDSAVTITGIAPVAKGSPVKVTLPNGTTLTGTVTDDEGHFTLTGTPEQGEGLRGGDPITVIATEDGQEITGSGTLTKVLDEPGVTASEATGGTVAVVVELPEGTPVGTVVTVTDQDNNPLGTVTVDGDGPVTVEIPAEKATGVDTVTVGLDVPADSHTTGPKPVSAEVTKAEVPAATTTPEVPVVPAVPVTVPDMPGGSEVVADPYNVAVVPTDNGATVNGETTPGATVTVTLPDGSTVTGTADADGSFSVDVPGVKAGDTLKVQASKDGTTSNVVTVTVPGATGNRGVLAMTGASSQVVALAAAVLVAGGFILLAATRRRKEEN